MDATFVGVNVSPSNMISPGPSIVFGYPSSGKWQSCHSNLNTRGNRGAMRAVIVPECLAWHHDARGRCHERCGVATDAAFCSARFE